MNNDNEVDVMHCLDCIECLVKILVPKPEANELYKILIPISETF